MKTKTSKTKRAARSSRAASGSATVGGITLLRDPNVVWYGPHPCEKCGRIVVKTGNGAPPLTLDAEDHNHHYPNFRWLEHQCGKSQNNGGQR